jgi:hypothetical protein
MNKELRSLTILIVVFIFCVIISGCSSGGDVQAHTVEQYLQALVEQDGARLSNLSCKDWEPSAIMEMDSFQAVEASLVDLACESGDTSDDMTLVVCQGKIVATYNEEQQELDLSLRTYQTVQEGSEWRVCGYR